MSEDWEVEALRRQDSVLASLEVMLQCPRRGLCLLKEWTRHYGTPGAGCLCHKRFTERLRVLRAAPPLEGDDDE